MIKHLSSFLKRESLWGVGFIGAALAGLLVAYLKGMMGCPLCAHQRWGIALAGLGFLLTLRFKLLGSLLVILACGFVMDQAYMQLILEHGLLLEKFAYFWNVYQSAEESQQGQLLPLLAPFYDLKWPLKKMATYSLGLCTIGVMRALKILYQTLGVLVQRRIRRGLSCYYKPKSLLAIPLFFWCPFFSVHAKDFGARGEVFQIVEEDFSDLLKQRAQGLDIQAFQGSLKHHVSQWSPQPVKGLRTTTQPRTFTFDPTYVVQEDLKDHEGRVFAPRGLRMNPLKILPFKGKLAFIQGDAPAQLSWAQGLEETKVILVSGSPRDLMKKTGMTLYFDQGGFLTKRLGIQQVPALVVQEGDRLRIDEKREVDL